MNMMLMMQAEEKQSQQPDYEVGYISNSSFGAAGGNRCPWAPATIITISAAVP
jgi:hypothetical protein